MGAPRMRVLPYPSFPEKRALAAINGAGGLSTLFIATCSLGQYSEIVVRVIPRLDTIRVII